MTMMMLVTKARKRAAEEREHVHGMVRYGTARQGGAVWHGTARGCGLRYTLRDTPALWHGELVNIHVCCY